MDIHNAKELVTKKCVPCEGGVDPCPLPFVTEQLDKLPGWYLIKDNQRIRKDWEVENFLQALDFLSLIHI